MTSHNGVQFKGHGTTDCMKLNMLFIVKPGKKNKKKKQGTGKNPNRKKNCQIIGCVLVLEFCGS